MTYSSILDSPQLTLPPLVWEHPEDPEPVLRAKHAHFITSHIYHVLEQGGYSKPHEWLKLYLTGSLCTYQYSDSSDCDVGLFVQASKLPEWSRAEMIGLMIEGTDGVLLPGTPYELQAYVVAPGIHPTDLYRPDLRPGYNIDKHKWISPPDHRLTHDVQAQEGGFYAWALQQADKMERLMRYEPDKANDFWNQIHRKRIRDQRDGKGDFSESNILYKFLFKRNLIPDLARLTGEHIAQHESLHGNLDIQGYTDRLLDASPLGCDKHYSGQSSWSRPSFSEKISSEKLSDLQGLPGPVNVPGYGQMQFGTNPDIERVANEYNQANGLGQHPTDYLPIQPETSQQIAHEYELMQHNPNDPTVAAAYQALANESLAQYQHAVNNGYNFEFYPEGHDPYPHSPREAVMDLQHNKHMYVYPTEVGYGAGDQGIDHPLLGDSGVRWGGRPVTHNDIFRAIHDFYGHAKEGLGFRHHGEDNAYRQHAAMFSPLAQRALASETRGQNSWVNFGPYGQQNQNANQAETVYAPQKAGLLPEWVSDPDLHRPAVFAKVAASPMAQSIYQATLAQGGITMSLQGEQPTTGYAFPPSKSEETIVPAQSFTPNDIDHFIADNYGALTRPGNFVGTWISGDQVYMDVSVVEQDFQKAQEMANASNQLAMYDINSGQDIPLAAGSPV